MRVAAGSLGGGVTPLVAIAVFRQAIALEPKHAAAHAMLGYALDDKCDAIIAKGNQARKHAAARANRYKTKYDQLLETLEALLPGAKALLTARAIPQAEKVKRLAALEKQIAQQKKRIQEKVEYDPQRYRDVYRPGYGQQCRLLKALLDRKHTLENQKSY